MFHDLKSFVESATLFLTVVTFTVGLFQYYRAQVWKKQEFVANEIRQFNEDALSRNAMLMLDWGSRPILLFPWLPQGETQFAVVDRPTLHTALTTHDKIGRRYTPTETAIRDSFDAFFNHFERFEQFRETGLVKDRDLRPYLQYWLHTLSDKVDDDGELRERIRAYLLFYRFSGTRRLLARMGVEVDPRQETPRNAGAGPEGSSDSGAKSVESEATTAEISIEHA